MTSISDGAAVPIKEVAGQLHSLNHNLKAMGAVIAESPSTSYPKPSPTPMRISNPIGGPGMSVMPFQTSPALPLKLFPIEYQH